MSGNFIHTMMFAQAHIVPNMSMGKCCKLDDIPDSFHHRCNAICAMGPNQGMVEALVKLINAGMSVAYFNFLHGDYETRDAMVQKIREAAKRAGKPVAVLLDAEGPEIRTGFFEAGWKINLVAGEDLKLATDYSFKGGKTCTALSYDKLCESANEGSIILCADGSFSLKVKS